MNKKISNTQVGVAGEYYVAAILSQMGYIASITLKNSKGVDILATNEQGTQQVAIQVKTNNNSSLSWVLGKMNEEYISDNFYYVFVSLHDINQIPSFYIVPSKDVASYIKENHEDWLNEPGIKGQKHNDSNIRKFNTDGTSYKDRWDLIHL